MLNINFVVSFRNVIDLLATNIAQRHWTAGKKIPFCLINLLRSSLQPNFLLYWIFFVSHTCIGLCGERCPPCKGCNPEKTCSISLRSLAEFDKDEVAYMLPECGCGKLLIYFSPVLYEIIDKNYALTYNVSIFVIYQ